MDTELISRRPEGKTRSNPILFVHGAFTGAWCWEEYFLPYFAKHGYDAYALSLRGHGKSSGRPFIWLYSLSDYVKDVAQAVAQMEKPPILIGHSMGGRIVQQYLTSSQVPAAVLMAAVPHTGLLSSSVKMLCLYPNLCQKIRMLNMTPRRMWDCMVSLQELRDMFFGRDTDPETVKKYFPGFQHESYRVIWDMSWPDFFIQPQKTKTPMLILGGEHDVIIPPEIIEDTAVAYDAESHIFPNTGHAMMLDNSWQTVADHIIGWLDKNVRC